jgi:hypothetical protein
MLKLKKIDLLTKNDKIHNKSEHGCCDHKSYRKMTCVEKRGWLFAVWEGRVGMRTKKEK